MLPGWLGYRNEFSKSKPLAARNSLIASFVDRRNTNRIFGSPVSATSISIINNYRARFNEDALFKMHYIVINLTNTHVRVVWSFRPGLQVDLQIDLKKEKEISRYRANLYRTFAFAVLLYLQYLRLCNFSRIFYITFFNVFFMYF